MNTAQLVNINIIRKSSFGKSDHLTAKIATAIVKLVMEVMMMIVTAAIMENIIKEIDAILIVLHLIIII